ncbi:MAG: hypothetical protein ACJ8H8_10585, partial [Geminicoccaceae bacterium]
IEPGDRGPARGRSSRTKSPTIPTVRDALSLHALRLKVGDDRFFKNLRAYYRANATSADFVDVAAGLGRGRSAPPECLAIGGTCPSLAGSGTHGTRQKGRPDASATNGDRHRAPPRLVTA